MRLSISESKNSKSLYVKKDVYTNGRRTSKIVEKLGTYEELLKKLNGEDPIEWAKKYIAKLNEEEQEGKINVISKYSNSKLIPKDLQRTFNGGYTFIQDIYYDLNLHKICKKIEEKYKFNYNFNSVLSRLVYARIIHPSSKLNSYGVSKTFIEQPEFELQHVYRALEVIAKESDFIEAEVYKNSLKVVKRNTKILYYDCTNFFFEIEEADGLKQYGLSKENRPNPIVQMGLFMDGDGLPLAFTINGGNTNEQITLKPIEERILSDFNLSKFIVCTDAGLSSLSNRKFNSKGNRAYIVTQSIKKLKGYLKEWALDKKGWSVYGSNKLFDLSKIDDSYENKNTYYKERYFIEDNFEQKLIVTYSPVYKSYSQNIRENQIQRAVKKIEKPASLNKKKTNDPNRFISSIHCTNDGEIAESSKYSLDVSAIEKESVYDGFYGVCTNLDSSPNEIIKINKQRWKIEESFRILKSEFKSRPVYLSRSDRIKAHFTTCFLSLLIYRILELKLENKYTCENIVNTLRKMNFMELKGDGYVPTYKRTDLTDDLHGKFGYRTDTEIVDQKSMKKILKMTKK